MRLDLYTKAVLTVIASCLLYLCFIGRQQVVRADDGQVVISGVSPDVRFQAVIAGVSEDSYHPFEIPVTIRSAYQNVPVSVERVAGAIPVANPLTPTGEPVVLHVQQR